jgi:hypothetical protein
MLVALDYYNFAETTLGEPEIICTIVRDHSVKNTSYRDFIGVIASQCVWCTLSLNKIVFLSVSKELVFAVITVLAYSFQLQLKCWGFMLP